LRGGEAIMLQKRIEKNAESITGMSVNELRSISPEKFRHYCERKFGQPFSFISEFPLIGRGNVLRDGIISRCALNLEIDRMLKN
jgi:hypothetical protein